MAVAPGRDPHRRQVSCLPFELDGGKISYGVVEGEDSHGVPEIDEGETRYGAAHLIGHPIRMRIFSTGLAWTTRIAVASGRVPHRRQARPCLHP